MRSLTKRLISVVKRDRGKENPIKDRETCLVCDASLIDSQEYSQYRICHVCGFHYSMTARERISSLTDSGTFRETNRALISLDPLSFSSRMSYKQRIFHDQSRTGLTEAVVTGTCHIGGNPAMIIALDFGFMGGTMGCVVGEKVSLAFEHAVKRKLPTVAVITSGGSRVQEGILSLMQMAKTTIANSQLKDKGLPLISILANPATGQAYASFANLADFIFAEPGAIVGFAPFRSLEKTSDHPLPEGSHTAESHLEHGMIDAIIDRSRLRDLISVLLDLLGPQYRISPQHRKRNYLGAIHKNEAWSSVQLARHELRPSSLDYIGRISTNFVELHGDRLFGDDKSVVCGLGDLGGQTVMYIGQNRIGEPGDVNQQYGRPSPEGFRKAQRALSIASKFDVPLITLIDTPGPNLSLEAEERGMGNAIATTMALMSNLETPTISVITGEGGSAGALALGIADRVVMMENAIYTAISPEEAAELIFQDESKAKEVAESLRLTAQDCRELGIVDIVVTEPKGGAHINPDEAARYLRQTLIQAMSEIQSTSKRRMIRARHKKFRKIGEYNSRFRSAITREVNALQGFVSASVKRMTRG